MIHLTIWLLVVFFFLKQSNQWSKRVRNYLRCVLDTLFSRSNPIPVKVLYVDDVELNLYLGKKFLSKFFNDIDIHFARNGMEAIQKAKQNNYQLIFMDCCMPILDGIEATKEIRKIESCKFTPIIGVTATGDPDECCEAGMNLLLPKPAKTDDFMMALSAFMALPTTRPPGFSYNSSHTVLIEDTGMYVWGYNKHGQLGLGHQNNQNTPQRLTSLTCHVLAVACGWGHSMALTKNGLYVWGRNGNGQLGLDPDDILSIHCGVDHSIALTKSGLYVWGHNSHGQLGLGHQTNQNAPQHHPVFSVGDIAAICCGCNHSMVLTQHGLYVWGNNNEGQLGLGHQRDQHVPQKLELFRSEEVISIACGYSHSMALTKDALYVWGHNDQGQLGLGHQVTQSTPQKLLWLQPDDIISIACGYAHSIAFTKNGLYMWGRNKEGQLGLGHHTDQNTPQKLAVFRSGDVIAFGCGYYHTLALTKNGLFTWGYNNYGQLGLGHETKQSIPQKVIGLSSGNYHWSYSSQPYPPAVLHVDEPYFQSMLLNLLKTGIFSDFEISVENRIFRLHRPVLATRCQKLLYYGGFILPEEVTEEIFNTLCIFLYTNELPTVSFETYGRLFHLSTLLEVDELEKLCQQSLVSSFSTENYFELLLLCAEFKIDQVVDFGIYFIDKNQILLKDREIEKLSQFPKVLSRLSCPLLEPPVFLVKLRPLSEALKTLYETKVESDFMIQVHGKSLQVHKCILGPIWDYFARIMLKETKHETVLPLPTFEKLLEYFYTCDARTLGLSDCGWLLSVAGYYCLDQTLTCFCDDVINSKITAANWMEAWKLGDELDNRELKEKAVVVVPQAQLFCDILERIEELQESVKDKQGGEMRIKERKREGRGRKVFWREKIGLGELGDNQANDRETISPNVDTVESQGENERDYITISQIENQQKMEQMQSQKMEEMQSNISKLKLQVEQLQSLIEQQNIQLREQRQITEHQKSQIEDQQSRLNRLENFYSNLHNSGNM